MILSHWYVIIINGVRQIFKLDNIWQDSLLNRFIWLLAILNVGHLLFVALALKNIPAVLVLHSNIYFGIDLIGERYYIIIIPLAGLLISFIHYWLARMFYSHDKVLAYFLIIGVTLLQFILFINTWLIININT